MAIKPLKAYRVTDSDTDNVVGIYHARNAAAARYKAYLDSLEEFYEFSDAIRWLNVRRAPGCDDNDDYPERFDYIRKTYSVPVSFGTQIICSGKEAVVIGTAGAYVKCFDGKKEFLAHPTSEMQYLNNNGTVIWPVQEVVAE